MAAALLDDVVDSEVLQARALRERLAVRGLAHAGRAGHDDIGLGPHGVFILGVGAVGKICSASFFSTGGILPGLSIRLSRAVKDARDGNIAGGIPEIVLRCLFRMV